MYKNEAKTEKRKTLRIDRLEQIQLERSKGEGVKDYPVPLCRRGRETSFRALQLVPSGDRQLEAVRRGCVRDDGEDGGALGAGHGRSIATDRGRMCQSPMIVGGKIAKDFGSADPANLTELTTSSTIA